nr:immunoglobulin heavy chain junction region [Macaca mulatta]MOY21217.1 immunoglobulin heavy chain junction region [Macaca mulatta]MOY25694.1 immunoglobulin heavy chain junction region [Macaca mulatta]MOY30333.1 immunoglobulin heavy chain junction region [Macaca mulatta]
CTRAKGYTYSWNSLDVW